MTTPAPEITTLEEALADLVADLGWSVTRTGTDLQAKIREHGAVIRVSVVPGGTSQTWQSIDRVRVEVFAAGYDKAWDTARQVDERLLADPFWAGPWLVDRVRNESAFAEHHYHESVRLLAAVYRVTTRSRP